MVYPQPQGQSTSASVASGTSIAVAPPGSAQGVSYKVGDFIIFALRGQASNATAVALPSGVVRLGPVFLASSANYRVTGLYGYRVLGDSFNAPVIPSSFAFTLTGASAGRLVAIAEVIRNVDKDTPVDAFYDSYFGAMYTKGVDIPSYATTHDGLTVVIAASEFAANNSEAPTLQDPDYGVYGQVVAPTAQTSGRTSVGMYIREQPTGATNEFIMTWGTPSGQAAQSVTLRGGAWPETQPPQPTPLAVKWNDGTTVHSATAKYNDGTKLHNISKITQVKPGRKVDRLFEGGKIAKIAHRGGSVNYKEMTLRGSTQSLIAGATAIEVSIAKTLDNKYFGLHDDRLDRTSPAVSSYFPGQHTWAEIQQLKQTAPTGNDTRFGDDVYWLFEDLVMYHPSTTYFVDPKVIGSNNWDSFLEYLMTFPNATNTFVIKYFHTATALALKARALGFMTWGYGYAAAVDGTPTETQLSTTAYAWDFIGMDYQANNAAWEATRAVAAANNNKIIGHICPTLVAAQRCIAQGAVGVMCSGINEVISL